MLEEHFSRRECLHLLAVGAVTTITGPWSYAQTITAQPLSPGTRGSVPATTETLRELDSHRVYVVGPVQLRPEYILKGNADGRQISLTGAWDLVEADDTLPPGQFRLDTAWIKVKMPMSVHYSLLEAGRIPNLWYGMNYKGLRWIQQRDWYLRKRFTIPTTWSDASIRLRFDGMDYEGMVWLDGEFLGSHEGMFGGPTFDITKLVVPGATHNLVVRLIHDKCTLPNEDRPKDAGKRRLVKSDAQAGESYQWGNRYETIGLYQPIRLIATGEAYLEAPFVRTDKIERDWAKLWMQSTITNTGEPFEGSIETKMVDLSNMEAVWQESFQQTVAEGISFWEHSIDLKNPKLWWPNGLGDQPLYRLEIRLLKARTQLDVITSRFGVRTFTLERNAVSPQFPRNFYNKGCATEEDEAYRYRFVVNGRSFYAKGACWVTSDDVLALTPEREEWMVRAAKLNGINLFRLNGGTDLMETEQFYDLCDENGIIVWQELPLNWIETTNTAPLKVWREQLIQNVLRLRQHPSLGLYVGGNEYNAFGEGIEPLLGVAREIFAGYDGTRPFRMNSPCGGDYHAYDYWPGIFGGDVNWYRKIWGTGHYFVSEWSFWSFANMSLLRRFVPAAELGTKPIGYSVDEFLVNHPTILDRSAELKTTMPICLNKSSYYGDLGKAGMEDLVEYSQMAYEHTVGCVLEEWRSQFPYKGGQTLWTYNSIGPVAESWALIDWCGQPQIPFYAAKRANEPVHVMAEVDFFSWAPGDNFRASVFALNDRSASIKGAQITARLLDQNMSPLSTQNWALDLPANGYRSDVKQISWRIPPDMKSGYLFLELTLKNTNGFRLSRRAYWVRVLRSLADPAARKEWQSRPQLEPLTRVGPWLKPQVEANRTWLAVRASFRPKSDTETEVRVDIRNIGNKPAYPVSLNVLPDIYSTVWSDNYFWLVPAEEIVIEGVIRTDMNGLDPFTRPKRARSSDLRLEVKAWNAPAVMLQGT